MKKIFSLFALIALLFGVSSFASNVSASAGPVGRNGLRAFPGPGRGQVTLEWQRYFLDGENFSIRWGSVSKSYAFAAQYVGYISTFTVGGLTPGQRFYFAVEGIRAGNVSAGWDGEVSAVAPSGPVTVVGTTSPIGRNGLTAKTGKKKGTVDLAWSRFFNDTQLYNIVYGIKPGEYIYGVLDARDTTPEDKGTYTFDIGALQSGRRYYFALVPQRSGTGQYVTPWASAVAR